MASSAFGGSTSAFGSYSPPKYKFTFPKQSKSKSNFFGNLIHDAESMATGIPMGLVMTAQHPIRTTKLSLKSMEQEYSPLVHGDFNTFYKQFHAHPLGPILDATALATMAVGGLGAGIKAADLATGGGRIAADLGKGESLSALNRAANHFRAGTEHTTKELPTKLGDIKMYQHYAANPVTRNLFQKPLEKAMGVASTEVRGNPLKHVFGEGGWYDYTPVGRGTRKLNQLSSSHAAATATAMHRQMWFIRKVIGDPTLTEKDIVEYLSPQVWNNVKEHSLKASPADVFKILGEGDEPPVQIHPGQESLFKKGAKVRVKQQVAPKLRGVPRHTQEWGYLPDPEKLKEAFAEGKVRTMPHLPADKSPEEFSKWINSMGAELRTSNPDLAFVDSEGNYRLVHQNVINRVGAEGDRAYKFMNALYAKPTRVWKWLVLAAAPRYLVNNMVGNVFMLAAATNPLDFTKSLVQSIHDTAGVRHAGMVEKKLGHTLDSYGVRLAGDWQQKWYLGEHHGFVDDVQRYAEASVLRARAQENLSSGLYGITSKVAHTGPRRMAINIAISKHPIFRKFYRQYRRPGFHGIFGDMKAFEKAANEASRNPEVRAFVEKQSSNIMGQYNHFNTLESRIRALVPFYSWDRHVMRWSKTMFTEKPGRTDLLLHTGQQGHARTESVLGKIPSFMEGAIPLPYKSSKGGIEGKLQSMILGPQLPGRRKILLTTGLNPPTAASDVLSSLSSLVSGNTNQARDKLGSQLNPFITGFLSGVTGSNAITGAKVDRGIKVGHGRYGGVLGTMLNESFSSTPGMNLYQSLKRRHDTGKSGARQPKINTRTGKPGPPPLFAKDVHQEAGSLLGVGVRDESPLAARRLYNEEHGISNAAGTQKNIFKVSSRNSKSSSFYTPTSSSPSSSYRGFRIRKPSLHHSSSSGLSRRVHVSSRSKNLLGSLGGSTRRKKNYLPKVTF